MNKISEAPPKRLVYAPGLDGLRAVACFAVILYHLDVLHVAGGYLGVTVFFTLSGFLITSLLLDEFRATGRVDLRGFWRRRVYRIIPLFWVVSGTCGLIGFVAGSAIGRDTARGATGSLLLIVNWLMIRDERFAGVLGGNWSVSVEEQFYLVWPLLFLFLIRRVRNERVLASAAALSAVALAVHRAGMHDWGRVWLGTDTQADALLIGCAVALGLRCSSRLVAISAGGVLVILLFFAETGLPITWKLFMPAVAVATGLLLPYLQDHGGVLAWPPLTALGRRSYGIYLWGGPVGYISHTVLGSGLASAAVALLATVAVAEVTYRLVEIPMRRRGRRRSGNADHARSASHGDGYSVQDEFTVVAQDHPPREVGNYEWAAGAWPAVRNAMNPSHDSSPPFRFHE